MKVCPSCGQNKSKDLFSSNGYCKECISEIGKQRRVRAKAYIAEYKSTRKCIVCGETTPELLEFHHRDPETKRNSVSDMIRNRNSLDTIQVEIDKCVLLCKYCHYDVHNGNIKLDDYL